MWALYEEYKKLFELENPLRHEEYLISNNPEEHIWNGLNLASVESRNGCDVFKQDLVARKLRQIPPQVNINLSNMSYPQINIPELPEGTTTEEINQLVINTVNSIIQSINNAIPLATRETLKNLPHTGFQNYSINSRWEKEV
ncbi:hypothetical protein [Methanobacterium sp. SMA-27]|uniref:hypothetical protein n=1 Tax=Methanobacterium sp. SMA-27 TaxID=1495336 RepID=UPI00064FB5D4|nr:hypothetical protein [Methanobacterium sp. SMA-27]